VIEKDSPTKIDWRQAELGYCRYAATMAERGRLMTWLQRRVREGADVQWIIDAILDEEHLSE